MPLHDIYDDCRPNFLSSDTASTFERLCMPSCSLVVYYTSAIASWVLIATTNALLESFYTDEMLRHGV